MLVRIGRQPELAPQDVVGALLSCHERIEGFCALAERLCLPPRSSPGAQSEASHEVADAAARIERYFRVALPLHVADEELSVRPRLLAAAPGAPVIEALDAMTEEHLAIEELLARLLPRWAEVAREPGALSRFALDLGRDSAELHRLFRAHLASEEAIVFPAIRERLAGEGKAIRDEMRSRRATGAAA